MVHVGSNSRPQTPGYWRQQDNCKTSFPTATGLEFNGSSLPAQPVIVSSAPQVLSCTAPPLLNNAAPQVLGSHQTAHCNASDSISQAGQHLHHGEPQVSVPAASCPSNVITPQLLQTPAAQPLTRSGSQCLGTQPTKGKKKNKGKKQRQRSWERFERLKREGRL